MDPFKEELEQLLTDEIDPYCLLKYEVMTKIADAIINLIETKDPNFNKKIKFEPPTIDQAKDYLIENGDKLKISISDINIIAEQFINYYESVNWKVGKQKKQMVNWKTSLNGWVKRGYFKTNAKDKSKVSNTMDAYLGLGTLKNKAK